MAQHNLTCVLCTTGISAGDGQVCKSSASTHITVEMSMCAGAAAGKLIPDCPPVWVTSVLFGGPFAAALRLLLQNDSVMELGSKGRIYGELLRLLDVLGDNVTYL